MLADAVKQSEARLPIAAYFRSRGLRLESGEFLAKLDLLLSVESRIVQVPSNLRCPFLSTRSRHRNGPRWQLGRAVTRCLKPVGLSQLCLESCELLPELNLLVPIDSWILQVFSNQRSLGLQACARHWNRASGKFEGHSVFLRYWGLWNTLAPQYF